MYFYYCFSFFKQQQQPITTTNIILLFLLLNQLLPSNAIYAKVMTTPVARASWRATRKPICISVYFLTVVFGIGEKTKMASPKCETHAVHNRCATQRKPFALKREIFCKTTNVKLAAVLRTRVT